MAYRLIVFLALLGFIACGDDGGNNNNTKMDAPGTGGDGSGTGTIDAPPDSPGMTADAGVGATCGSASCTTTQECCLMGGSNQMCVAQNTCSGVAFGCDGPEDCEMNQVCCYGNSGSGSAGTGGSECRLTAQCQINACHVDTDCMTPTGKCCQVAMSQYKVCLAQCPPM